MENPQKVRKQQPRKIRNVWSEDDPGQLTRHRYVEHRQHVHLQTTTSVGPPKPPHCRSTTMLATKSTRSLMGQCTLKTRNQKIIIFLQYVGAPDPGLASQSPIFVILLVIFFYMIPICLYIPGLGPLSIPQSLKA
jgi:hypothetical protein